MGQNATSSETSPVEEPDRRSRHLYLNLPNPFLLIAGYALALLFVSSLLISYGSGDQVMFLLVTPIVWASLFYSRHVYYLMTALLVAASLWVVYHISLYLPASLSTIAAMTIVILLLCETFHYLIRQRRQAEIALRASEARYRRVVERANDGIAVLVDGVIEYCNPQMANMLGYPVETLVNTPFGRYLTPEHREMIVDRHYRRIQGEPVPDHYELRLIHKDEHSLNVEVSVGTTEYGGRLAILAFVRDITERRRAEERTLQLQLERERVKLLERFIDDTSRNLKTPLTTMKVSLSVLQKTNDTKKWIRHLNILEAQASHLERLLEDLLSMTRLDQENAIQPESFDLHTLVQDVLSKQQSKIERKNQAVHFVPAPIPLTLFADSAQLRRAIYALLNNAVNYTPDGGTITVRTALNTQKQQVIIEIKDTGIGIHEDELPRIFERFYRADRARETVQSGTGLGLPIAKKIVEAHQGHIEIESEPDAGSSFRIVLPVGKDSLCAVIYSVDEIYTSPTR